MKRAIILFFVLILFGVVSAQDGDLSPSDVGVSVDNDAPLISILSPQGITYNNATPTLFNFSVFDLTLDSVWYSFDDGGTNTSYLGEFYLEMAEGNYNLTAYANDSLNRITSSLVTFVVNNSVVVCGNSFCDASESCSTCAIDCGVCPGPPGGGGDGGGGGTGGGTEGGSSEGEDVEIPIVDDIISDDIIEEIPEVVEENIKAGINFLLIIVIVLAIIIIIYWRDPKMKEESFKLLNRYYSKIKKFF